MAICHIQEQHTGLAIVMRLVDDLFVQFARPALEPVGLAQVEPGLCPDLGRPAQAAAAM